MDIRHSSRMTTKHREPCPAGCEELNTQAELAKRMLCSRSEAGQRIVFGKLKAHSATANQVFYRTDDLNVYRGAAIAKIAESVRQLNASERDRIVRLIDLDGDGQTDRYDTFNDDHQVTEHFHEFAMGLETDADGNVYYAKSARHALPAVVPHHGTLLKVKPDGSATEIVAQGFRAANGVCVEADGT